MMLRNPDYLYFGAPEIERSYFPLRTLTITRYEARLLNVNL